jgi:CheY-like chemotaxis protein
MLNAGATGRARSRVLLVEDHQDTRQMYAEFLSLEFEVMTAADGEQALVVVQSSAPDVMVTDLSLPGIDGFELIARVRADPVCGAIPIICLSGYGGHAHEQRAQAAGCDRILQKPCMPDKLSEIIGDLIQGVAGRRTHT